MELHKILGVVAWPLVVLVAILIFYKPLIQFVNRLKKFKGLGLEVEGPDSPGEAQSAQITDRSSEEKEAIHKLIADVRGSIALNDMDFALRKELEDMKLNIEGDIPKVLIRYLASASLLLQFEQIHNLIFGTQIVLLKRLNEVRSVGRQFDFAAGFFLAVQERYVDFSDWDLQQYVQFLKGRNLVSERDGSFFITPVGGEYLSWIATQGRSEDKQL